MIINNVYYEITDSKMKVLIAKIILKVEVLVINNKFYIERYRVEQ